jgi:hypothetical protein
MPNPTAALIGSCGPHGDLAGDELDRVTSPDAIATPMSGVVM